MIGIALNENVVAAGTFVTGEITWTADSGPRPRQFVAVIEWALDTEAPNRFYGIARERTWNAPADRRDLSMPFRLLVPFEGPISYTGKTLKVNWKLKAIAVLAHARDNVVETEFTVIPREQRSSVLDPRPKA